MAVVADRFTPPRARQTVYLRRRVAVLSALVLAVFLLGIAVGRIGAAAELSETTAGHEVVSPGETLWDVAVRTAPPDSDPRPHLAKLRAMNGLESSRVDAWTVVAVPAR